VFAATDGEVLGRQVGIGIPTDEVEGTNVDVVSVMSKWKSRYDLKGIM